MDQKKNLKKLLFPLFSLFLTYRTVVRFEGLLNADPSAIGFIGGFIITFVLTLYITGIFAFIGFAYPTHKLLPPSYYKVHNPAALKRAYKLFGVEIFRALLLRFFWGLEKNRKKYFDGTRAGVENFIFQTKQSEFGHLGALVLIQASTVLLLLAGHFYVAFVATLINIVGNGYPIILQRTHRMRVGRLLQRMQQE